SRSKAIGRTTTRRGPVPHRKGGRSDRERRIDARSARRRSKICRRAGGAMTPEIGHYALVLALALALVQAVVPIWRARLRDAHLMSVAAPTALAQFLFVAIAFAALTTCYVTSDFSVMNVVENSHSAMPLLYKFTSVWGNHEGSMMLWVLILSFF